MATTADGTHQTEQAGVIRLLVADDDPDLLDTLRFLFEDVGYGIMTAASLAETLECIETGMYSLIVTDLFTHTTAPTDDVRHLAILCTAAYPTPVVLASAWNLTTEEVLSAGFAAFVAKPFAIEDLLSTVAGILRQPFTASQRQQKTVLRTFLDCLSTGMWEQAMDCCADDVTYVPPLSLTAHPHEPVIGKSSYHRYIEETARAFPRFRCTDLRVFALPRGLSARFTANWGVSDEVAMSAGLVVEFAAADNCIRQIGVRLNIERLRTAHPAKRILAS
jgi:CheY-like chemotaxis protein